MASHSHFMFILLSGDFFSLVDFFSLWGYLFNVDCVVFRFILCGSYTLVHGLLLLWFILWLNIWLCLLWKVLDIE